MTKGCVYKVSSPSGRIYVGQTIQRLISRKQKHVSDAYRANYRTYNTKFSKAIRKYKDMLKWMVLEEGVDVDSLAIKEVKWIEHFNSFKNGYNSTMGGDTPWNRGLTKEDDNRIISPWAGKKFSDEHKKNLSQSKLGKTYEQIYGKQQALSIKKKKSESMLGEKHPFYGKTFSQEHREKLSKSHKGKLGFWAGKNREDVATKLRGPTLDKVCLICDTLFNVPIYKAKQKYCSNSCRYTSYKK